MLQIIALLLQWPFFVMAGKPGAALGAQLMALPRSSDLAGSTLASLSFDSSGNLVTTWYFKADPTLPARIYVWSSLYPSSSVSFTHSISTTDKLFAFTTDYLYVSEENKIWKFGPLSLSLNASYSLFVNSLVSLGSDGRIYALSTSNGNVYAFASNQIRRFTPQGNASTLSTNGMFVTNPASPFKTPTGSLGGGLAVSSTGDVYVPCSSGTSCFAIALNNSARDVLYPTDGCADGPVPTASFSYPKFVAIDGTGAVYVSDSCLVGGALTLRLIINGVVSTLPLPGATNTSNPSKIIALAASGNTVGFVTQSETNYRVSEYYTLGSSITVPPGFFNDGSSVVPIPCPAGRFGSTSGLTSPLCTGPCQAGYACAPGSTSPKEYICPPGTWAAAGSGVCSICNNGTYGNTSGLTTPSCSGSCSFAPPGYVCNSFLSYYSVPLGFDPIVSGSTKPSLCPIGHYCPDFATILPCPPGTYICIYGVGDCMWPPVNFSSSSPIFSSMLMDSFGTLVQPYSPSSNEPSGPRVAGWGLVRGFTKPICSGYVQPGFAATPFSYTATSKFSISFTVTVSALGNIYDYVYSGATGTSTLKPSSPCPLGFFCPGASPALPCPPGSYTPITKRSKCLLCSSGSFQPLPGQGFCDGFCPIGKYSMAAGALNESSCQLCDAGKYGVSEGSSGCIPCPISTFSTALGATSSSACTQCPPGKNTLSTGSYSPTACVTGIAFVCPVGFQPSSISTPTSLSDCVALTCPLPLTPANETSAGCSGCGYGTFGSPSSSCTPCGPSGVCPGLTSNPLFNFIASFPTAPPAGCPYLTPPASTAPAPPSTALAPSTLTYIVGGTLLGIIFCATLGTTAYNRLSGVKLPESIKPYVRMVDLMSSSKPIRVGDDKILAERESSTLGASMTLFAFGALGVVAAVLTTQREQSNTLTQQSLGVLRDSVVGATSGWAWAQAGNAGAATVVGLPPSATGVYLRFSVSGEPGTCIPGGFSTTGLSVGGWVLLPSQTCTTSTNAPVSQFTYSCSKCMFTPLSSLTFTLPYSCQSLLAEALAVDADGSLNALSLPPNNTVATAAAGGALLSSITWTLSPLFSQLNNTLDPTLSRKGWQLLSQGSVQGPPRQLPNSITPGQLTLLPLSSGVTVTVNLALQPYFSSTTLSQLTSVVQLISSIVGFQGIVFTFVSLVFGVLSTSRKHSKAKSERVLLASSLGSTSSTTGDKIDPSKTGKGWGLPWGFGGSKRSSKLVASKDTATSGIDAAVKADNPLVVDNPLKEALPANVTWTTHTDGQDTWYTSSSGESVWTLPKGAVSSQGST